MVLVAVGQDEGNDVVNAVFDRGEVGKDEVDTGVVLLGEEHAAVDDEQLATELEDGHVAADLTQASQRSDAHGAVSKGAGGLQRRKVRHRSILPRMPRQLIDPVRSGPPLLVPIPSHLLTQALFSFVLR